VIKKPNQYKNMNQANTYSDFLIHAKEEQEAINAKKTKQNESVKSAGPITCLSSHEEYAIFHDPNSKFDWGSVDDGDSVEMADEVGNLEKRPNLDFIGRFMKGNAENGHYIFHKYSSSKDLNLEFGKDYYFFPTSKDFIADRIEILEKFDQKSCWPPNGAIKTVEPKSPQQSTHDWIRGAMLNSILGETSPGNCVHWVEGPPGTGKTRLLADIAVEFAKKGKKVGVIAVSHPAVDNALLAIHKLASKNISIHKFGKYISNKLRNLGITSGSIKPESVPDHWVWGATLAGSTYLLKRTDDGSLATPLSFKFNECDVLLIDESSQVSSFDAAALQALSNKMVFFGDRKQLPYISSKKERNISVIDYLNKISAGNKMFLDVSNRMNSYICDLIRKHFYPLINLKSGKNQNAELLIGNSPGVPSLIKDASESSPDSQNESEVEAKRVVDWVEVLCNKATIRYGDKKPRPVGYNDIAILTPFRNQVKAIKKELGVRKIDLSRVGTVDKMQGQGVGIVIYSLTSSDSAYIYKNHNFIFSPNRWNVAISRAACCVIMVGDINRHMQSTRYAWTRKLLTDPVWTQLEPQSVFFNPVTEDPETEDLDMWSHDPNGDETEIELEEDYDEEDNDDLDSSIGLENWGCDTEFDEKAMPVGNELHPDQAEFESLQQELDEDDDNYNSLDDENSSHLHKRGMKLRQSNLDNR
jgi:hypothetical protein